MIEEESVEVCVPRVRVRLGPVETERRVGDRTGAYAQGGRLVRAGHRCTRERAASETHRVPVERGEDESNLVVSGKARKERK